MNPRQHLPAPAPTVLHETQTFWDATARGELLLQRCAGCGTVVWYPRGICPQCSSTDLRWFRASGRAVIYSWTTTMKGLGEYSSTGPYVLAYVQLEEGPRIMTNLVDHCPEDLIVGNAVEVVFHDTGDGSALPRFRPA